MSQSNAGDFPIDPQVTSGTALAEILNRFYNATNTQNSGATEPPVTYPGMFWYDTSVTPPVLKIRNAGNSGWVDFADSIALTPADITGLGTMATVNSPAPIANGGTGATTAANALVNLGADAKYLAKAGGTVTGGLAVVGSILAPNIELGPTGDGSAFIDFKNAAGDDFDMRIAMWGASPDYLRFLSTVSGAKYQFGGASGGIVFENVNSSGGTSAIAIGYRSDGQLGLRVDSTQFNNVWPIIAGNSNAVSGVSGWNYSNRAKQPVYFWVTDGSGNDQYLTSPSNIQVARSDRVNSLEGAGGGTFGSSTCNGHFYVNGNLQAQNNLICNDNLKVGGNNYWRWFWNGAVGDNHFYAFVDNSNQGWATLNSDERLKEDMIPLVSSEAAFMQIAPINFAWKKINGITNNTKRNDGLSAQNIRALFPDAAFGDFDTPPDENGNIMFPGSVDDRAVLAHVILRVQDLINRVKALETV